MPVMSSTWPFVDSLKSTDMSAKASANEMIQMQAVIATQLAELKVGRWAGSTGGGVGRGIGGGRCQDLAPAPALRPPALYFLTPPPSFTESGGAAEHRHLLPPPFDLGPAATSLRHGERRPSAAANPRQPPRTDEAVASMKAHALALVNSKVCSKSLIK